MSLIDKIITEWSYRVHDGIPNKENPLHIVQLRESLEKLDIPISIAEELIQNLINEDGGLSDKEKEKAEKMGLVSLGYGNYGKEKGGETTHRNKDGKLVAVGDETPEKDTQPGMTMDPDGGFGADDETEKKEKIDTKVAVDKLNDKRYGVSKKIETQLNKGYITKQDAKTAQEFHQDMNEFLKNPTKEVAEALVEKYKLSQNANGKKLYLGFIAGDGRKLLGEDNLLIKEVSNVINQFVDLKAKGDVQKKAADKLQSASKPGLTTVIKSDDEGVKRLFNTPPYDRLDEKFHQIFGPTDENGNSLRPSSEYSKEYFQQSVNENESLDKTIEVLKELEEQGTAAPGVRKALEKHKVRMAKIAKDFDKMTLEQRRKAVEKSYSDMAREMHEADSDTARGIMKNMAEMALYDSEIAGGEEAYLPSAGTFPSGDKLRVDRDGNGVVEKIAAVSVKFGKSGGVYGFPGESTQYVKFHPDEDKRTSMRNRVGHAGHSLGVRDDLIQEPAKFNKMLKESGLAGAIKEPEKLRQKFMEMQKRIDELRESITNDKGKYSNKDLVTKRKELEAIEKEAQSILKESVDEEKLVELLGKSNAKLFMSGGAAAVNIICMASALKTSDGLSVIEHNHQIIDKNGLHSETDRGTPNLKDWKFQFRAYDKRGGGLLAGFVGGDT